MKTLFYFITSSLIASLLADTCTNLEISLTQKIGNEGFHREINWLLERNLQDNCKILIRLEVTKGMYVNPDEIADLNHLQVHLERKVDVEVPAHLAEENVAYIFTPNTEKASIILPFHLRYQRAQISGGFGKVTVKKPSILTMCPNSCEKPKLEAPCDVRGDTKCIWKNTTYQALFDEVELLVPIGDLDDYPLISIVTLLLSCAGCIYTLSVLSTTPL